MKNISIKAALAICMTAFLGMAPSLRAQDSNKGPIHTEKRTVTRNGDNSTVTIVQEDRTGGADIKRTITIVDGDTVNQVIFTGTDGSDVKATTTLIDVIGGDSLVKINSLNSRQKQSIMIINGDTTVISPEGNTLNINVDTSVLRKKYSFGVQLGLGKKGLVISDKYVYCNLNKLSHKDSSKSHWHNVVGRIGLEGFDLGFTQFVDGGNVGVSEANHLLDLNVGKSVNVNFRVCDLMINLSQHKLYLDGGLEFDLHDYRFNNNVSLKPNSATFGAYNDSATTLTESKLSTQYLELPLMLCYNSDPRHQHHAFTIGGGGYGGILLGSYTKQVSNAYGTQRFIGDFHCNAIDYGVMGVIGYGDVQVYGKFNMSPLFSTAAGVNSPDLQSFTVGIRLLHSFSWR